MARLGFAGLGIMGAPMARSLLRAGHSLSVWSRTSAKAAALAAEGALACDTPAALARNADVVFLCVGDTSMSRQTILGPGGIASGAVGRKQGGPFTIVDCSTISPSASRQIAAELDTHGINFLDAPCSGSKSGAESASLTFMIGGDRAVFDRVRPFLEAMGKQLYFCGGPGMGLQAKLSQNMILGGLLQSFNESFVLATKAGIPPELMLEIINNSAARSGMVSAKAPLVLTRNFAPNFSTKWLEKDMALMLESAAELQIPAPITALSREMLRAAIASGYGEDDYCGSIRVLEKLAGCDVTATQPTEGSAS